MKTKYILTSLALASTLIFASCKEDRVKDEPIQRDTTVEHILPSAEVLVDVSQGKATATTCELTFSPRKKGTKFVSLVMPREVFNVTKESDLSTKALEQLTTEAKVMGKSLGEYLTSIEASDTTTRVVKGLTGNTAYSVVTFERDGNKLKPQPLNERFYFSTAVADKINLSFETKTMVDGLDATLSVKPSDKTTGYYVVNIPKIVYFLLSQYKKMSDEEIVYNFFKRQLYGMLQYGSEEEMDAARKALLISGDHTISLHPETENTEYEYLIASITAVDPFTIVVTSDVTKGSFTSGKLKLIDCDFDIKAQLVDDTHFSVNITPSKNDVTYIWRFATVKSANGKSPEQLADDILKGPIGPYDKNTGVKSYASLPIDQKGVDQYIMAFGFQGKTRVTNVAYFVLKTGSPADPSTLDLQIKTTAISPYSATLKFTSADKSIYYGYHLRKDSEANSAKEKQKLKDDIKAGWEAFHKANPGIGMERYIDLMYSHGTSYKEFTDLEPGETYTLYTYALSQDDGSIVKFEEHSSYLTTPEVSTAEVTPEVYGVFDADSITKDLINNIESVQGVGAAVVVVKYNFSEDAVGGYGFLLPKSFREVELDSAKISDKTILTKLKGKFIHLENKKGGRRYQYYACLWGQEQVSLTYAEDAKGGTSKIRREKLVKPLQAKADSISKLSDLIHMLEAEATSSSSSTTSTSFVALDPLHFDLSKVLGSQVISAPSLQLTPTPGKAPLKGEPTQVDPEVTSPSTSTPEVNLPVFTVVR